MSLDPAKTVYQLRTTVRPGGGRRGLGGPLRNLLEPWSRGHMAFSLGLGEVRLGVKRLGMQELGSRVLRSGMRRLKGLEIQGFEANPKPSPLYPKPYTLNPLNPKP